MTSGVERERLAKLRLARTPRIGPVTYRQLIARYGSAHAALEALPHLARRGGRSLTPASAVDAEREMELTAQAGAQMIFVGDQDYSVPLSEIESAPPVISVRGNPALMAKSCVAMVGARNSSAAARRFTRELAQALSQAGMVVVSGLARGVDAEAHVGALNGGTIGVIAGGIDVKWPRENDALHEDLYARGLVIAEQPFGMEPRAAHFPRRNRIISGLSRGTVVMEAAPRSGSLITARMANEQGREVMAVPGFPLDPRARGCNGLIRDGATLVQSVEDIIETLTPLADIPHVRAGLFDYMAAPVEEPDDGARVQIESLLSLTPVPVDELVRLAGMPPATVATVLLELELAGRVHRHAGARISLSSE
jgi:DNA processing protein|tara:strand:- start:30284 stop:31381 length:1098 start_codon:yes stop_codon:yes gene_type:complete